MRVSFYSSNKLREFIRVHKDSLLRNKKLNVIYKIFVRVASYVRQMYRQLRSRITECKNHIQQNTSTRNVITEHRLQEGHGFYWEQHYNPGRGASLQEEIDFGDDIHQETDAWTQLADDGGASQGLPPNHTQAIKARVVVQSINVVRTQ